MDPDTDRPNGQVSPSAPVSTPPAVARSQDDGQGGCNLISPSPGWQAPIQASVRSDSPLAQSATPPEMIITTISYGQSIPSEEVPQRRTELIREAYREGRVKRELVRPDGTAVPLEVGIEDIEHLIEAKTEIEPLAVPGSGSPLANDWDGDGFVGLEEQDHGMNGPFIADIPDLEMRFSGSVTAGVEYEEDGSTTVKRHKINYRENEVVNANQMSGNKEIVKPSASTSVGFCKQHLRAQAKSRVLCRGYIRPILW